MQLCEQWVMWTTVWYGQVNQKRTCSQCPHATDSISLSILQALDFHSPTSPRKYMFYVVFNRGLMSYWSWPCSLQSQMRERKKSIQIPGCSAVSQFRGLSHFSLSVLNYRRTALCPNFEKVSWSYSSTSCNGQLCYLTSGLGATPLLGQIAWVVHSQSHWVSGVISQEIVINADELPCL